METYKLRILHISDLHAAGPRDRAWRRQRVLGDAWKRNLDELLEDEEFDLVCFTGDVAYALANVFTWLGFQVALPRALLPAPQG